MSLPKKVGNYRWRETPDDPWQNLRIYPDNDGNPKNVYHINDKWETMGTIKFKNGPATGYGHVSISYWEETYPTGEWVYVPSEDEMTYMLADWLHPMPTYDPPFYSATAINGHWYWTWIWDNPYADVPDEEKTGKWSIDKTKFNPCGDLTHAVCAIEAKFGVLSWKLDSILDVETPKFVRRARVEYQGVHNDILYEDPDEHALSLAIAAYKLYTAFFKDKQHGR